MSDFYVRHEKITFSKFKNMTACLTGGAILNVQHMCKIQSNPSKMSSHIRITLVGCRKNVPSKIFVVMYQKQDLRIRPHQSLLCCETRVQICNLKPSQIVYLVEGLVVRHPTIQASIINPSFGMTTKVIVKDVFLQHAIHFSL